MAAAVARLECPPDVECRAIEGHAVVVLTEAAEGARMFVLGSRGRGRVGGALLGSVAAGCIRRGRTPVLVVPEGAEDPRIVVATRPMALHPGLGP